MVASVHLSNHLVTRNLADHIQHLQATMSSHQQSPATTTLAAPELHLLLLNSVNDLPPSVSRRAPEVLQPHGIHLCIRQPQPPVQAILRHERKRVDSVLHNNTSVHRQQLPHDETLNKSRNFG
jgi:hypothetical protein